ncbi:MAG: hypothetical protein Q9191_000780 [Dirinaria sp. TL-2023a]
MGRERFAKQSLGALYSARVKQARILLVGAGGIGCELLKNLVLTGFGEVHIVDLDTIDLSNLNRQFLFRHEHIKKSKALIAKESAAKFNPHVRLQAYHANIKDPQFNVDWFGSFNLVFNALDNLDARRHVNKMCLAADVPLIESGTTGFNGQVQVIKKVAQELAGEPNAMTATPRRFRRPFLSARYEAHQANRFTALYGQRAIYSRMSHLLQKAASLTRESEIFGISEEEAPEMDLTEDSENAKEIENLRREAQALKEIRNSMGSGDFPRKVFEKVFTEDVDRLRTMDDMWKSRKPPQPLQFDQVAEAAAEIRHSVSRRVHDTWSLAENFSVFCERYEKSFDFLKSLINVSSLHRLSARLEAVQAKGAVISAPAVLAFDKDDDDTLDFVASTANLRAIVFGIEPRSKFDIKQMAGNIIPAIATTNAMTAGLCVLQAFKILREDLKKARMVFLERSTARVINTDGLRPPNPNCNICGVMQSRLFVDLSRATLNDLVEDVLKTQLEYGDEFTVNSEAGILYDPELDDNLSKTFSDLGIKVDNFLTVIDDDEKSPRVNLSLSISERTLPLDSKPVLLPQKIEIPAKPTISNASVTNGEVNGSTMPLNGTAAKRKRSPDDSSYDQEQLLKRKREAELETEQPSSKSGTNKAEDTINLDDTHNGAIVIDD